jgi:hypothetical protein
MARISNFLLKNFNFDYFKDVEISSIIINNNEFFNKTQNLEGLFFLKKINLKKINTFKKCVNIIYF